MLQCACREAKALTQRAKQPRCPVPYCPVSVVVPSRPELRRDGTGRTGQDTLLVVRAATLHVINGSVLIV